MADALLKPVLKKLFSLAENELATVSGIKGKVENLSSTLEVIQAVVEQAEQKQMTNKPIAVWLEQLKDAVYVLDDILDECSIESHRLAGFSSLIKNPSDIMFRRKIGNRLKEITVRFDKIAERKNKFIQQGDLIEMSPRRSQDEVAEWRETSPTICEPQVYGREDDKEIILEFLLSKERNSDSLSVYPIVGLGGMGKTTLFQEVYNDAQVSGNFNPKIWICVSENFSVKRILRSVVEFIMGTECPATAKSVTETKVKELLQSKKYLLVLDDVWIQNDQMKSGLSRHKWTQLKSVLSCGSKGASILVSTRDTGVADIMGTCPPHRLQGLSDDDCWLLFKKHAFGANNEECANLIAIGKEIVKKCGGSPLAARALGDLLLSKKNVEKEWVEVKESSVWNLPDESSIFKALRLSYFHLTPTLRQCFAFCAMFPKDTKIIKEDLIYLWMANGFISSRKNMEVEDVGNTTWNELCQKSFFQDISTDLEGRTTFKMHDLVHDLAESVTGKECVILKDENNTNLSPNTHHVLIDISEEWFSLNKETFKSVESLRTLYQLEPHFDFEYAHHGTHQSLRVLQASYPNLPSLENLIHLRYLELLWFNIQTLPDSIYNLRKLEILKLKHLEKLTCLPEHLTRLQNLRHLIIENCPSLSCMLPNIGKLSCLRTLSKYIVSSKVGHSLVELRDLELSGDLDIVGLENVGSLSEAQHANLKAKRDLHKLSLSWSYKVGNRCSRATNLDEVLEALQPHSNLKKLNIKCYEGLKFPSWIGMLNNLVDLELRQCHFCVQVSGLGKLPSLRRLELEGMDNMKYIDDDESYDGVEVRTFPSLKELSLTSLPKLERLLKLKEGKGEMLPCLTELRIVKCPKLKLPSSCIPSLTTLLLDNYRKDLASFPVGKWNCLQTLKISNFQRMKELPEEFFKNLNALEKLVIKGCSKLECLPGQSWEGFLSLRTLEFSSCDGFKSLPDGIQHLSALENLNIYWCTNLKCLPKQGWEGFRSLRTLKLQQCYNLKSLPDGIQHLNALEELVIDGCDKLECLPEQCWEGLRSLRTLKFYECEGLRSLPDGIQHLNALEKLVIYWCSKLECLPEQGWEGLRSLRTLKFHKCEGLRSLPDGVRHLTSLQRLKIRNCPVLEERCKEGTGEDWDKIRYVPEVKIVSLSSTSETIAHISFELKR